jgi:Methylase involved in ubiquinone/menaquinone biosynthesis
MSKGDIGLGEDWEKLIKDFEILAEYYDEGNKILSFGNDIKFRTELLNKEMPESGVFLDIGCGPGTMSVIAKDLRPDMKGYYLTLFQRCLQRQSQTLEGKNISLCAVYMNIYRSGMTHSQPAWQVLQ